MRIDSELFDLCKDFIKENQITSSDTLYDRDSLQLQALELLEQICDLIGYHEDEEELDFEEE
jgi:hypothetical protein